ncbi:MAG: hypothetical protein GWN37_10485 [Gammaproteobacteria bacterium]|nr:hypothetical protein [Gammaproteobacteria bacterium]
MNKRSLFAIVLSSLAIGASGCATIMTGTDQDVLVRTEKDVRAASCKLEDSKGRSTFVASTPDTVTLVKGDAPLTVTCEKEGYKTATAVINETISGATFGNLLLGGVVGVAIDAASGAAQKYPPQIIVWLEPVEWESEAQREQWLKEKREFEVAMGQTTASETPDSEASNVNGGEQQEKPAGEATDEAEAIKVKNPALDGPW